MDKGKMKNMVVLKDLPSNLIDEAIIILKPNKRIKKVDYVKHEQNIRSGESKKSNRYKAINIKYDHPGSISRKRR